MDNLHSLLSFSAPVPADALAATAAVQPITAATGAEAEETFSWAKYVAAILAGAAFMYAFHAFKKGRTAKVIEDSLSRYQTAGRALSTSSKYKDKLSASYYEGKSDALRELLAYVEKTA